MYACENSKIVSLASSIMINIIVLSFRLSPRFRFPIKLTFYIAFDQHQLIVVYLNLLLSFYSNY